MGLMENIRNLFTRATVGSDTGRLPHVHLFGHEKTYGKAHPQQFDRMIEACKSWVYACAWKNATSVAKVPLNLYKQSYVDGDEQLDTIDSHVFLDLMRDVNAFTNTFELKTITQMYLELTGNAYWYMPKNALGIPMEIWNLPPQWMKVVPSKKDFIAGYVMNVPNKGEPIPFQEDEIVHFKFPSPFDLFYGASPTLAAMFGVDLNTQSKTWAINFFMNNAQPSGVLQTDEGLDEYAYQRLRDNWNRKYRGSNNAGKIAILEQGLKYQQIGSGVGDASYEGLSRNVRDEILAMFGVPASKLGLVEDVNRANADANDYTYQKETILPRLTLMEEKINEKIIPMYDVGITAKFDNPVPQDTDKKLQEMQMHISSGYSSIDEERIKDGLEPYNLPETSVPLIPFNLVPAGQEKPQMDAFGMPTGEGDKEEDKKAMTKAVADRKWEMFARVSSAQEKSFEGTLRRYVERQQSEVMRRLAQYKSVKKDIYGNIIFNENEANEELKRISESHIRQSYITGLSIGVEETGHAIDFDLFDPNITRAVNERNIFLAEHFNKTTANLISEQIGEGLASGETMGEITARLDRVWNYRKDFSVPTTARTETIGALNEGQIKSYLESGLKYKQWLTARDERVRHSHQIDGQKVGMTETFTTASGARLLFPADRSTGAPAGEVINCRCTVLPSVS